MAKKGNITLVVSDSKSPLGSATPGKRMDVVGITLAGPKAGSLAKVGSRLCGGTSTCLALMEIDKGDPLP